MRSLTRAQNFNTAYSRLHKISFRMNGRSTLYILQFCQIILLKFGFYKIIIYKNFICTISFDVLTVALWNFYRS